MQGFYVSSEGSPEATFLLVENYNYKTASVGLRIGWEFLKKKKKKDGFFFIFLGVGAIAGRRSWDGKETFTA